VQEHALASSGDPRHLPYYTPTCGIDLLARFRIQQPSWRIDMNILLPNLREVALDVTHFEDGLSALS
jgi:hypothetical protein